MIDKRKENKTNVERIRRTHERTKEMKRLKRKIALLLSLCLVLTGAIPAYADEVITQKQLKVQEEVLAEGAYAVEEELADAKNDTDSKKAPTDTDKVMIEEAIPVNPELLEPALAESLAKQETESVVSGLLLGSAVVNNPGISFTYDKESYTYPDPVTITARIDDVVATPSDVTWYQVNVIGDIYNETSGNPLVLPATVPSSDNQWFAEIKGEGVNNTEINIKEPDRGMVVVFDNQPVYAGSTVAASSTGASGSVSLSGDGLTATISNVRISECDDVPGIFAKLMIYGVTEESYHLLFEGDSDFGEEGSSSEGVYRSITGGFYSGSKVEIRSAAPGTPINLKGASYDFFETGYLIDTWEKITKFTIKDINWTAYSLRKLPFSVYATQLECSNCTISAKAVDYPGAVEIGLNNLGHEENEEYSEFTNCIIDAETDYEQLGRPDVEGAPSPYAFNCSHNHVLFKDCTTVLKLDHTTLGECRGVYMLSGELTVDGGTLDIEVDCPLEDLGDPRKTDDQVLAAAIQAVSFSAKNHAQVNAEVSNAPHSSWGIIYARDVIIENSNLDIDVLHTYEGVSDQIDKYGSCTEGIYYFGDDEVFGDTDVWKGIETEHPDELTYVGNVVISQGSNVDICLEGTPYEYTTCGISGRYVSVNGSDVSIDVQTYPFADSELYSGFGAAFVVYDFAGDADIELDDATITSPSGARIQAVERESIPKTEFYTILDESKKDIAESVKITKRSIPDPRYSSGTYILFTGSTGNPVTNGSWKINTDGSWTFATSRMFTNTWGFIRYMVNGVPVDNWFWFDKNGKMLTGWQQLYWNGKLSWFYFNEIHDGTFGACQLGGITPDGYKLGLDGAWIED